MSSAMDRVFKKGGHIHASLRRGLVVKVNGESKPYQIVRPMPEALETGPIRVNGAIPLGHDHA